MGDTSGNQGMPGGMNFGDIRRRLQQMQGGGVPAPPQGQPNPAPPAPPQKTAAPGADGAGMTAQAPATQPIGGSVQVGPVQNPYLPPGGTGPKDQQGGDPTARRAVGPPQTGAPAVSPGAPIGPGTPPPQPRRALGTESRGGQPSPGNPSPGGPRGQNGIMPQRTAVGAPQAGGWQPPTWGVPGSGSAGMPNTPAPQPAPTNPYANMTQQQKDEVLKGMKPNPAIQKIDPGTGKPYTTSQMPGMSPGNPYDSPVGKPAFGAGGAPQQGWKNEMPQTYSTPEGDARIAEMNRNFKPPTPEEDAAWRAKLLANQAPPSQTPWQPPQGNAPPRTFGGPPKYTTLPAKDGDIRRVGPMEGGSANFGFDGQRRPIGPGGQGGQGGGPSV